MRRAGVPASVGYAAPWRRCAGCPFPAREPSAKGASRLPLVFPAPAVQALAASRQQRQRPLPRSTSTPGATILTSLRTRLRASGCPRILPPAKSRRPLARRGPLATAPLLPRDCPPLSIMDIRRCCGAALDDLTRCEDWPRRRADRARRCAPSPPRPSLVAVAPLLPPAFQRHRHWRR